MSMAGRCIAASTASGTFVGPGILRNSRPLATLMGASFSLSGFSGDGGTILPVARGKVKSTPNRSLPWRRFVGRRGQVAEGLGDFRATPARAPGAWAPVGRQSIHTRTRDAPETPGAAVISAA